MPDERPVTDHDLASLLDEARGAEAAAQRSRQRWLRQQTQSDARLSGLLLGAAERSASVSIRTTAGRTYAGKVAGVGSDFCTIRAAAVTSLVRLDALGSILPGSDADAGPATDPREPPSGTNFVEILAERAADRPVALVEVRGHDEVLRGALVAVGADVATSRPPAAVWSTSRCVR